MMTDGSTISCTTFGILAYFAVCLKGNTVYDLTGSERLLFQNLTFNYNSISRPVRHAGTQVKLRFAISLNQILGLDGKHQILSSYVWIHETWYDENLKWLPGDFHGIDKIMFAAHHIWLPDIYIFNIAGRSLEGFVDANGTNVLVRSNGHVTWPVPLHIKSACLVDATFFPYDKQICDIQFGSWIYDISQIDIDLQKAEPDLTNYIINNEFDIDSASLSRTVVNSSCCPGDGDHPMVHLNIRLKRKTNYYDYIVIAPTINLCVLTLATFLLPCECGWKIAIGLTVFLTLYVLQLLIAENVPDTSSTPLISVFLLLVMSLNCLSLITATIVMNIKHLSYHDPPPEVPKRLLNLCEHYLSKLICARLSDWKRIASNPEEKLLFQEKKTKRAQLISTVDSFVMTDRSDSRHAQYVQLNELPSDTSRESCSSDEIRRNNHTGNNFGRTTTAESSFSYMSNTDNFMEEVSYTDQLLKHRPSEISEISKLEKVNHSFQDDDSDFAETSFSPGSARRFSRNRPSYRKAIRFGHLYNSVNDHTESTDKEVRQSVIASISRKYQWYFVADVIDTITFLIYIIVMFLGIFTVLVITPLFA